MVGYSVDDRSAWLKPLENLTKDTRYLLTVEPLAEDLSSNALDGDGDGVQEGVRDTYFFDFYTIPYSRPIIELSTIRALEDERKRIAASYWITLSTAAAQRNRKVQESCQAGSRK